MNYAILVFSWIWLLIIAALLIGTALTLRSQEWSWTPKHRGKLVLGLVLFALGYLPGVFEYGTFWSLILLSYLQLAGLTIPAIAFAGWIAGRKRQTTGVTP